MVQSYSETIKKQDMEIKNLKIIEAQIRDELEKAERLAKLFT